MATIVAAIATAIAKTVAAAIATAIVEAVTATIATAIVKAIPAKSDHTVVVTVPVAEATEDDNDKNDPQTAVVIVVPKAHVRVPPLIGFIP